MTTIQLIGLLRMLPISVITIMAIYRKNWMVFTWSSSFLVASIANAFFANQFIAGTFSSISAYAAAYILIPYLARKNGRKW